MADVADSDRRRLEALLRVDRDEHLETCPPDPPAVEGAEWAAGFSDPDTGVSLSVYFIRDPATRSAAGQALAADGARAAMNGGMLAVGRSSGDADSGRRLKQLLSRFAGEE